MKNENPLHTFESWTKERELNSLMESADLLIKESKSEKSDISSFEGMTDDQIDEACEKEFSSLMKDDGGPFGSLRSMIDEDITIMSTNADGEWVEETIPSSGPPAGEVLAAATVAAAVVGTVVGAGVMLYKFIKKRREIKKALSGIPDGPKKEALRAQYKEMGTNELEQVNQIKAGKAKMRGAKDAGEGKEPNLSEDPSVKSAYLEGYKEGEAAKNEIKDLKDMPKEEKADKVKAMRAKVKAVKSYNDKVSGLQDKLDDLQK